MPWKTILVALGLLALGAAGCRTLSNDTPPSAPTETEQPAPAAAEPAPAPSETEGAAPAAEKPAEPATEGATAAPEKTAPAEGEGPAPE